MFLKSEIRVSIVCKRHINMDKKFFDENLLLLLFQLLKFRKLRKSKSKKIYIRRRPPKFWVQSIFNYNLQQNLRFLQLSSRYYLLRQKQPPEVFCKHRCSQKFLKIHRKTPVLESLFNKASGLWPAILFKKRLQHRCFPVNFVKFLRTSFYIEHLWWLLSLSFSLYHFAALSYNTGNSFTVSESYLPPLC